MASVKVTYFAVLKDLAGKADEQVDIESGATASRLYCQLAEKYGFPLALSDIRVAVNDDFSSLDYPVQANDHVVFIPPVAGG